MVRPPVFERYYLLATQGWQKALYEKEPLEAVDRLVQQFTVPLSGGFRGVPWNPTLGWT